MFVCYIDPECKLIIYFSIVVLLIFIIFDSHGAGVLPCVALTHWYQNITDNSLLSRNH